MNGAIAAPANMAINSPIDSRVRIGHVHLKVANLDRALNFYCGVLGFELISRIGDEAAFVSAGGYHHHIGLNTWESKDGSPPPTGSTGLYHLAILYPERRLLADAFRRLLAAGILRRRRARLRHGRFPRGDLDAAPHDRPAERGLGHRRSDRHRQGVRARARARRRTRHHQRAPRARRRGGRAPDATTRPAATRKTGTG